MSNTVLITGASGQIGSNLVKELIKNNKKVIATDIELPQFSHTEKNAIVNVLDNEELNKYVAEYRVSEIYHLAAILSATGEQKPQLAWDINMKGLLHVLDIAKEHNCKVFWPSSIAVFGPTSQKHFTPQSAILEPETVYGISKVAGELWCNYYFENFDVDVRSIRFPGLISWKGEPGGGTTDYANEIFFKAVNQQDYSCFLKEDTYLPMMYMDDAISGMIQLMSSPKVAISVRTSYNLSGMSFAPKDIYQAIQKVYPNFSITYSPDFRQQIAESWPASVDDQVARNDWQWEPKYDLEKMVHEMISQLKKTL